MLRNITKKNLLIDLINEEVKKIPKGRVTTYGQIAGKINKSKLKSQKNGQNIKISPRYVGYVLHLNSDPRRIPCHRVVNAKGGVADNYKFGGWREQKKKLIEEGIEFISERNVDINKFNK